MNERMNGWMQNAKCNECGLCGEKEQRDAKQRTDRRTGGCFLQNVGWEKDRDNGRSVSFSSFLRPFLPFFDARGKLINFGTSARVCLSV